MALLMCLLGSVPVATGYLKMLHNYGCDFDNLSRLQDTRCSMFEELLISLGRDRLNARSMCLRGVLEKVCQM